MKYLSITINAVLAIALGVLFILHFSLKSKVKELETSPMGNKSVGSGSIVFINIDSLYTKYDRYIDMKSEMEGKQKKMENELGGKRSAIEKSAMDYQEKMQKGLLLRSEASKIEQQLAGEQQNLMRLGESMQNQLAEESQVANRKLINSIVEYLKEYNKSGKYQFILSHAFGGNLLYANEGLDITKDVLKGLNEKYNLEKKK